MFTIQTHKQVEDSLNIIQLTDSHLFSDPHKKFAGILPTQSLQAILQQIRTEQNLEDIDAIITTGDIAQEAVAETYTQYFNEVEKLNRPHFVIPGNHDSFEKATDLAHKDNDPIVILGKTWCLILLNSQADKRVYGEFSKEYLLKVSELLKQYHNYHVLIALHHHPFPVGSTWLDQHRLHNPEHFLACLTEHKNVKVVIFGHVHQEFEHQAHGILFLSSPATSIQFKPKSELFRLDDCAPGYRMLSLHADGSFDTQVFRLPASLSEVDHSVSEY